MLSPRSTNDTTADGKRATGDGVGAGPVREQPDSVLAGKDSGTGERLRAEWGAPFAATRAELRVNGSLWPVGGGPLVVACLPSPVGRLRYCRITPSTSSRFCSIIAAVVASRFRRSSGSVFEPRTLKCQSGYSAENPSIV